MNQKTINEKRSTNLFNDRLINYSLSVICLCDQLKKEGLYYSIIDQLIRSSTSVGANIVESKGSSSRRDYTRYFEIALKSANEAKYWLALIKRIKPNINQQIQPIIDETEAIVRIIAASLLSLRGKR